jgi:diamine N-acetyltransferase
MNPSLTIRTATATDIQTIGYLAYQIWPFAYRDILTLDQLQYMLNKVYSSDSLASQMQEGHQFLLVEENGIPMGFASYSAYGEPLQYKLHKLYVRTDTQGKGLGKSLLEEVVSRVKTAGGHSLLLQVNRNNRAVGFYQKMGFRIEREEDISIGNGYYMNDYIMKMMI